MAKRSIATLRNVKKAYLGNLVFEGLDLSLEAGNFYALLGKNGSGKSTLIRMLAHREAPSSGEGEVLGVPFDRDFAEIGNDLAYVSEATYLPPGERIQDLIELHSKIFKKWDSRVADRLATGFRLDTTKKAGELSRGQLVQTGIVLSLSYNPSLILLDEVTAVLDASARSFLMRELVERVNVGATVFLATNIVTEVQGIATALVLIGEKRIKVNSTTNKIAKEFVKLKRHPSVESPVFLKDSCIEVGLSASGTPMYLIAKKDLETGDLPKSIISEEPIFPVEIFIYLTRLRD